jgi:hypothetical protein
MKWPFSAWPLDRYLQSKRRPKTVDMGTTNDSTMPAGLTRSIFVRYANRLSNMAWPTSGRLPALESEVPQLHLSEEFELH